MPNLRNVWIDTFTSLDDLPKKLHGDPDAVLDALRLQKRVSSFELSENLTLWRTIEGLKNKGTIKLVDEGYPWYRVEFTDTPPQSATGIREKTG